MTLQLSPPLSPSLSSPTQPANHPTNLAHTSSGHPQVLRNSHLPRHRIPNLYRLGSKGSATYHRCHQHFGSCTYHQAPRRGRRRSKRPYIPTPVDHQQCWSDLGTGSKGGRRRHQVGSTSFTPRSCLSSTAWRRKRWRSGHSTYRPSPTRSHLVRQG